MSLNNTCDIFEGHIPFIKKTHVILEYGKPIYPKELDKDEKKRIGEPRQFWNESLTSR